MSINLQWVSLSEPPEKGIRITTAITDLKVYQYNNVILKTEWCMEKRVNDLLRNEDLILVDIQNYLNNPTKSLMIHVQTQGSEFRRKVWSEICNIPVGQVLSYSELANKVNSGARAVANACRDNPFPGLVPCHRVVAIKGLGGFMGETDGPFLGIKRRLLEMESKVLINE